MQLARPLTQNQIDAVLEFLQEWGESKALRRLKEEFPRPEDGVDDNTPKTQQSEYPPLRVGMHLRYRWTERNAIKQFGEEHTGRVAQIGPKWIKLVNDNAAITAIWPFDEIERFNIVEEVAK